MSHFTFCAAAEVHKSFILAGSQQHAVLLVDGSITLLSFHRALFGALECEAVSRGHRLLLQIK